MLKRWLSGAVMVSMLFLSVPRGTWAVPVGGDQPGVVLPVAGGSSGTGVDPAAAQVNQDSAVQAAVQNNPVAMAMFQAPAGTQPVAAQKGPGPVTISAPPADDQAKQDLLDALKQITTAWAKVTFPGGGLAATAQRGGAATLAAGQLLNQATTLLQNAQSVTVAGQPNGSMTVTFTVVKLGVTVTFVVTVTTGLNTDPDTGKPINDPVTGKPIPTTTVSVLGADGKLTEIYNGEDAKTAAEQEQGIKDAVTTEIVKTALGGGSQK